MAKKEKSFLYDVMMPKVYGLGAAVVIIGALFKIQHWDGADIMLIVGLGTEALIFALSAFQPVPHEPQWDLVYPQLADDYAGGISAGGDDNGMGLTRKLDDMLKDANVTPTTISSLGDGLRRLSDSTEKMADLGDATVATQDYTAKIRSASSSLERINEAYTSTVEAMSQMAAASADAREYHEQVQNITKNLAALNAVYEMELTDANKHMSSLNKFYGTLSVAMENMVDASKDTEQFKNEVSKLTGNLHSLNTVYGNMLNAMRA
ncbi:MAG: gliding motility protein GldL [Hymenobacteraceae bacterium]|nr:gliding motility protein GldL [Hymenobacteraceae bacterium]